MKSLASVVINVVLWIDSSLSLLFQCSHSAAKANGWPSAPDM